mgnify:FL=1
MKKPNSQMTEVLHYLIENKSLTKLDSFRKLYVLHVGEIIRKLRAEGISILTEYVEHKNKYGRSVRYARYVLCSSLRKSMTIYDRLHESKRAKD